MIEALNSAAVAVAPNATTAADLAAGPKMSRPGVSDKAPHCGTAKFIWKRPGAPSGVPFVVTTARQLLAEPSVPRRYLLDPWLREQESVLLYAPTGAGKSLFALTAALAVAGSGSFLNWSSDQPPTPRGWRVLYVDGEMHEDDVKARLRGLLAGARLDRSVALENLTIFSRQRQKEAEWFPSITDEEGVAFYRGLIDRTAADLVVFDNFSTLGEVEDENSASAFNTLTSTLLSLKSHGVSVVLVHHTGKDPKTFRGSSRLAATFEVILKLDPDAAESWKPANSGSATAPGGSSRRSASFLTRFEKMRSGVQPAEVLASLQTIPQFEGEPELAWTYEVAASERLAKIRRGLEEGRWARRMDIAAELGVDPATVTRALQQGETLNLWSERWVRQQLGAAKQEQTDTEASDF